MTMPSIREDPLRGHRVIFSEERARRPREFTVRDTPRAGFRCPFCPGHEADTPPEKLAVRDGGPADSPGWRIRVVPNRYPALHVAEGIDAAAVLPPDAAPGYGFHEVVIETERHDVDVPDLSPEAAELVVEVWRERARALVSDPGIRHVVIFKNFGERAGATLSHPHSQIIALPFVPPAVSRERRKAGTHNAGYGSCHTCRLAALAVQGGRKVLEVGDVRAWMPWAPRVPFETWITPVPHEPHFAGPGSTGRRDTAVALAEVLRRVNAELDRPAYNLVLHVPAESEVDEAAEHWRIEVLPKLTHLAGFELGTGTYLNPVLPEDGAARLRGAGKDGA